MAELQGAGSANNMPSPPAQLEPVRGDQARAGSHLSALAAMSGQEEPGGQEIVVAINAEDMEANFQRKDIPGNNSEEVKTIDSLVDSAGGPPPGFGGQHQLQDILGITPEQLRKGRISPEQLRAGGISQEQLRTGEILPQQLLQGGILPEQLQAGGILFTLPGQLRPPVMPRGGGVPSQDLSQRQVPGASSTQQFDLSKLAAMSRQVEVAGGQELLGTINADNLVTSFYSKSSPGNNSLVEEKNVDRQSGSSGRSGGQQQQNVLDPQEQVKYLVSAGDSVVVPVLDTAMVNGSNIGEANKQDREHTQTKTAAEKYSCQKCNKTFSSLYWSQKHTLLCGHRLPCKKCNQTFKNARCLNKHIKVYHGDEFRCLDCGECFATEKKLRVHKKKTHVQICPWCKVESKNIRALRKHMKKNCKGKKQSDVKLIVSNDTEVDGNEKVNTGEMSSSKMKEKGEEGLSTRVPNKVEKKKKYPKSTKLLNCKECHKSYETPGGLRKHMNTHIKAMRTPGQQELIFENDNFKVLKEQSVPVEVRSVQSETGNGDVLLGEISVPVQTVPETQGFPLVEYTVSQLMEQDTSGVCAGPIKYIVINTE